MLNLNEFKHNYHLSGVNLLANFITRGISVIFCEADLQRRHQ